MHATNVPGNWTCGHVEESCSTHQRENDSLAGSQSVFEAFKNSVEMRAAAS